MFKPHRRPEAWRLESREGLLEVSGRWTLSFFELHAAAAIHVAMLREAGSSVRTTEPLAPVMEEGARLVALTLRSGRTWKAKALFD